MAEEEEPEWHPPVPSGPETNTVKGKVFRPTSKCQPSRKPPSVPQDSGAAWKVNQTTVIRPTSTCQPSRKPSTSESWNRDAWPTSRTKFMQQDTRSADETASRPFNAFARKAIVTQAASKPSHQQKSSKTEVWNDWPCPNLSCKNHRTKVFGKNDRCKRCGAARPTTEKPVAVADMANMEEEPDLWFEFPICRDYAGDAEDGLSVRFQKSDERLIIIEILQGGAVANMNAARQDVEPDEPILACGDVVLAVNGFEGGRDELEEEWEKSTDVTLRVHRSRSVLLDLLKEVQRANWPAAVNAWNSFCDSEGGGNRFPSIHNSSFIRKFLVEAWPNAHKPRKNENMRLARADRADRYWAERGGELQRNLARHEAWEDRDLKEPGRKRSRSDHSSAPPWRR